MSATYAQFSLFLCHPSGAQAHHLLLPSLNFLSVFHIPFVLSLPEKFTLHSILERKATAEHSDAREFFPGVKVVTTLEEVLSDEEVDAVFVTTINATHFDFAKVGFQGGCFGRHLADRVLLVVSASSRLESTVSSVDSIPSTYLHSFRFHTTQTSSLTARSSPSHLPVIIEKPLVPTFAESQELIDLARAKNLVLATYHNRRWDADFLTLKSLIDNGTFGELSEFEVRFCFSLTNFPRSLISPSFFAFRATSTATDTSSPLGAGPGRRSRPLALERSTISDRT